MLSNSEQRALTQFLIEKEVISMELTFESLLREASQFKDMLEKKQELVEAIRRAENELDSLIPLIEKKKEKMRGLLCLRGN